MSLVLDSVRELMMDKKSPIWRPRILKAFRSRVDEDLRLPLAIPAQAGGWMHQYVCPEHELSLIFDIKSPGLHRCPQGCAHQDAKFGAAFRVFAHRHYAALVRDAAVLYLETAETKFIDTSIEILTRYSDLYQHFDGGNESQPWMLSGKAFHQALTEAIWAVPLAQAYDLIRPNLADKQQDRLANGLLRPITVTLHLAHQELVFNQNHLESNYSAWLIAALGCLGFALDDDALIHQAIHGPGGFAAHLNAAILPDGFEYGGSPYYHNFVAWAYTLLAETALRHGMDLYAIEGDNGQSIQQMWSALASIMWPDGSLPFLHDGNYWQYSSFDAELCEVYEVALARTGESRYAWLLDCAYRRRKTERDTWTALMFADLDIEASPRPLMKSNCLKDIGVGVLRDDLQLGGLSVLMHFGPYGGSHTHLDLLTSTIFPFSLDAGNPRYGVETRRTWYQQSAAHNTVLVDGQSQAPSGGELLFWTVETGKSIMKGAADNVYPGVKFSRQVALGNGLIHDHASLISDDEHIFDWLLHTDVLFQFEDMQFYPNEGTLFPDGAATRLHLVSRGTCAETMTATLEHNSQKYRLQLSSPTPFDVFLARSPQRGGIDMSLRYTLIARVRGHQADFFATYEMVK